MELLGKIESVAYSLEGLDYSDIEAIVSIFREVSKFASNVDLKDIDIVTSVIKDVAVPEIERRLAYRNGVAIQAGSVEFVDRTR